MIDLAVVFMSFFILGILSWFDRKVRDVSLKRTRTDWWIDGFGLFSQGLFVPFLQIIFVSKLFSLLLPQFKGVLASSFYTGWGFAFFLNFIVIDFLYYWNHRIFHSRSAWWLHKVHHSSTNLDILATSRNSFWTIFFLVYLWLQGLMVYLLADSTAFLVAAAVSASLDLWRHSSLKVSDKAYKILSLVLITPREHRWHHSRDVYNVNFGANLCIWDRIFGTYHSDEGSESIEIGIDLGKNSLNEMLFLPWRMK